MIAFELSRQRWERFWPCNSFRGSSIESTIAGGRFIVKVCNSACWQYFELDADTAAFENSVRRN